MNITQKIAYLSWTFAAAMFLSYCGSDAYAAFTPSPEKMYESGEKLLTQYQGNPETLYQAKTVFTELITQYPRSPLGFLGLSRFYVIDAYRYEDHYDIPQIKDLALPYAMKAMATGPLIPAVHDQYTKIEEIFSAHARHQEIIQNYLALFPKDAKTYFLIGEFFCDRGDYTLSLEAFQKALDLKPTLILKKRIFKRLAWLYLEKLKQPEQAVTYLQKAVEHGDTSSNIYEFLGIAQLQMKQYPLAVDSLRRSVDASNNPMTRAYLLQAQGYLHESQGQIPQAIHALQNAAAINYQQSSSFYSLGSLFYKIADYPNAYHYFSRVIVLEPKNPDAYYFAGRAAQFIGKEDQAADYYRRFLQLRSDGEEADWIRKNIPDISQKPDR